MVAQWGSNGWKVNPNIVGGKKRNRSFGVPGTDGTNFGFCEKFQGLVINIFKYQPRRATAKRDVISSRFAAHRLNWGLVSIGSRAESAVVNTRIKARPRTPAG